MVEQGTVVMPNRPIWPVGPLHNASDVPLSSNPGTLPNMSDAVGNWFQLTVFEKVVKTIVNFVVVETTVPVEFQGVVQTFTPRQLMMKPEGQRRWKWKSVFCYPNVPLSPDDVIIYEGIQYRVMASNDFKQYGYWEFHIQSDYTGSGPTVE